MKDKAPGWMVSKTTTNLAETLRALKSLESKVYVTGTADLPDVGGRHTVNITGIPDAADALPFEYTSKFDEEGITHLVLVMYSPRPPKSPNSPTPYQLRNPRPLKLL